MDGDRFEMGQRERDRLKVLHEAEKRCITQRQAAEQLGITERQVRRLLARLRALGDRAVLHGLRGELRTGASIRNWSGVQWPN